MANIMIVDDSPIIRRSLRNIFESLGHRVAAEAEDGRGALEKYKKDDIDLITMDIQLPGLDGIEAVRLIRERNPQAAIVMISSVEQRSRVYDAIRLGARHYIVKPFTADKVNEVVQAVLGLASASPAAQPAEADKPAAAEEQPTESAGRFAKAQEPVKLTVPALPALPYELIQKDGRVVLIVQKHINGMNVVHLHAVLQGMLYFRKAKFVLELWEPIQHEEGMRLLLDFVGAVRGRNGTVGVVTADTGYHTLLSSKLRTGVYRSYADIEW